MPRCLLPVLGLLLAAVASAQPTVRVLPVAAYDVVWDPVAGRLYASVPDGAAGGSVVAIDPVTGEVTATAVVAGRPAQLAISDDGTALYAGLLDQPSVARIDVGSWAETSRFGLGTSWGGALYANDLAVQPGRPGVVAVSRRGVSYSPSHEGVAIYDEGVPRTNVTQGHTGSNVIAFGATPDRLYGYNNETTEFGFRRLAVDASGVRELTVDDSFDNPVIEGFSNDIVYAGGRVYASNGSVVDAEARQSLGRVSRTPIAGDAYPRFVAVRPVPELDRVVYLVLASGRTYLAGFDATSLAGLGYLAVEGGAPANEYGRSRLARWGERGVAYPGVDGLVLVESALFDAALAGIETTPTSVDLGRVTDTVEQAVVVRNPGNAPLRVTAVRSDVPAFSFTPSTFELAPGASLTGSVRYRPMQTGYVGATLAFDTNTLGGEYGLRVTAEADVTVLSYGLDELDFGPVEVGEEASYSFYVYNPSPRAVHVREVRAGGPFSGAISDTTVQAYGSVQLRLAFRPTAAGPVEAAVVVESDSYTGSDTLAVRGSGVRIARLALEPGYLALGDVLAGQTLAADVFVRNVGSDTLRVTNVRADGPFSFAPTAFELSPGDTLAAEVRFVAARLGGNGGALAFESNDPAGGVLYVGANVVQSTDGEAGPALTDDLSAPTPNPVRGAARVAFVTATTGHVRIDLYDTLGRRVRAVLDEDRAAGPGDVPIEASTLPAGVYVVRIEAPGFSASRPLTVVR